MQFKKENDPNPLTTYSHVVIHQPPPWLSYLIPEGTIQMRNFYPLPMISSPFLPNLNDPKIVVKILPALAVLGYLHTWDNCRNLPMKTNATRYIILLPASCYMYI